MRHGDTGMKGQYIGATDVPVSESGVEQVKKTGKLLRSETINKVYCSPMLRCRQTADILDITCPATLCSQLKEINFGRWEGKKFEEIAEIDKTLVDSWVSDPSGFCFPGGESVGDFRARVGVFAEKLVAETEKKILVVSHGGVLRHLLCLLLGISYLNYVAFEVKPGCLTTLRLFPEGGVLTGFNLTG